MTDKELARRAALGDREAQTIVWERFGDKVIWHARAFFSRDWNLADDAAQETAAVLFKRLRTWNGKCSLGSWIYTITRSQMLMYQRSLNRRPEIPAGSLSDMAKKHEERFSYDARIIESTVSKQQLEMIHSEVRRLPTKYRNVIKIRSYQDLSNEETAEILQLSVPAVKSRWFRGKEALKKVVNG